MNYRDEYTPGPANSAHIEKSGESWALVLVKELHHPPEKVWEALTDPAHLKEWAPFEADTSMGKQGAVVTLTTVGTPSPVVAETVVTRADAPRLLEYTWGENQVRWELSPKAGGTVLTLWHNIDRRYIAMGAAGWHICLDVLDHLLQQKPIGRIVAGDALQFEGWQRLYAAYSQQFSEDDASQGGVS